MQVFHKLNPKHWILDYGFEEKSKTVIDIPCQYETCIKSKTGLYNIWVGIDFNKYLVHIYEEYNCGGEVSNRTFDFRNIDVDEEYDFMIELDTIINDYVEER